MSIEKITKKVVKLKADQKKQIEHNIELLLNKVKDYDEKLRSKQITQDLYYDLIEPIDTEIEILKNELKGIVFIAEEIEEFEEVVQDDEKRKSRTGEALKNISSAMAESVKDRASAAANAAKDALNPKIHLKNLYGSIKGFAAQEFPLLASALNLGEDLVGGYTDARRQQERDKEKSQPKVVQSKKQKPQQFKVEQLPQTIQHPEIAKQEALQKAPSVTSSYNDELNTVIGFLSAIESNTIQSVAQLEDLNRDIRTLVDITANAWGISQQQLEITKDNHQDMIAESRDARFQKQEDASLNAIRQVDGRESLFKLDNNEEEKKDGIGEDVNKLQGIFHNFVEVMAAGGFISQIASGLKPLLAMIAAPLTAITGLITGLVATLAGIAAILGAVYVAWKAYKGFTELSEKTFGKDATLGEKLASAGSSVTGGIVKPLGLEYDEAEGAKKLHKAGKVGIRALAGPFGSLYNLGEAAMPYIKEAATPYDGPLPASAVKRKINSDKSMQEGSGRITRFMNDPLNSMVSPDKTKDVNAAKLLLNQQNIETYTGNQIGGQGASQPSNNIVNAPISNNVTNNNIFGKTITTRNPESPGMSELMAY